MSRVTAEELSGLIIGDRDEKQDAIAATGGKPQLLFPFLVDDFSDFAYFDKDLYKFNGKCYEPFTDLMMDRYIRNFYVQNNIDNKYTTSRARELKAMMKFDPGICISDFDEYDNLVNLNNGIYNYDTKLLFNHSKDYKFTYTLNINYNPLALDCPNFMRFLQGCFANSGNWEDGYEYDEDTVENIIRLCGYLLYPRNTIEGIFIFLGEGSNGKSVLMDVLRMFFPSKYITNLSLNTISNEDGFQREKLIRSRINFCTEQKGGSINSEELKKVASGEGITVQRKFNEALDFKSHTKIVVSANNMPYFNDTTHGILRRLYMFSFKNRFVNKAEFEKERDHTKRRIFMQMEKDSLMSKLISEKEAIFNLFLGGLERLREAGWQFIETKNMQEIKKEYKEGSDAIGTWLAANYDYHKDGFLLVDDLYNDFREWYYMNYGKATTYSNMAVSKKIKNIYRLAEPERRTVGTSRAYGYPLVKRSSLITPFGDDLDQADEIVEAKNSDELNKLLGI